MKKLLFALFIITLALVGCSGSPANNSTTVTASPPRGLSLDTFVKYVGTKGKTIWLLTGDEKPEKIRFYFPLWRSMVSQTLELAGRVGETGVRIKREFSSFNVGALVPNGFIDDSSKYPNGTVQILYYPKMASDQFPTNLLYYPEQNHILVSAIIWPQTVFSATLIHELNHAMLRKDHPGQTPAATGSEAHFKEEVVCETLGMEAMNTATNGGFYRAIDEIFVKTKPQNWMEIGDKLTIDDLKSLDRVVGAVEAREEVGNLLAGIYLKSLGFRYIESHFPKDEWSNEKLKFYTAVAACLAPR